MPRGPRYFASGTFHHEIIRSIEQGEIVTDDEDHLDLLNRIGKALTLIAETV